MEVIELLSILTALISIYPLLLFFFSCLPPFLLFLLSSPLLFLLSSSPLLSTPLPPVFIFSSSISFSLLPFSSPPHPPHPRSTGEFLSLAAMDTFLRSVQPEVNDLFVLSLVLINLLAWMDLFITQVTACFSIRLI